MKPLIIFDCDGVLVDSESIASAVFSEHLIKAGFSLTPQQCFERFTGLSLDSCRALIEMESATRLPEEFFPQLQRDTLVRFSRQLEPVRGVTEVLDFLLEQRWSFCVASSGSYEKMATTLKKTGLQKYFTNRIFSASDVQRGKPAPDLFLHAARMQGYCPAHCIVIEDSAPGVLAALAAGMQVCVFGEMHGEQHAISADAQRFTCMSELPTILASIEAGLFTSGGTDANSN
ncbi:MAG TPA: HAD family phosphatase [Pseudomonadales bacterium]|nr:HAD family phosphatase [Pseudomonadales bacterium]